MSMTTTLQRDDVERRSQSLASRDGLMTEADRASAADEVLFGRFLEARTRARGPIVFLNSRVMFRNAGATRLVHDRDRDVVWAWARLTMEDTDRSVGALPILGLELAGQCDPVVAGMEVIGAIVRLGSAVERPARTERTRNRTRRRASFGWASLRDSELGVAELVAQGLTNREIGARLFLSRHTVDAHLRQIFRKLGICSRVELTRLVVEWTRAEAAPAA
jgi:DNA-binding CsgD family transcriptional regulator